MATGILGQAALSAAQNTAIYTVPSGFFTVLSINVLNRGNTSVNVRLALANSTNPTDAEYIEFDVPIGARGVLERTGIMMNAGKVLVAFASNANVSVNAFGIETSTT
jgi:hypothetical protein